MKVLFVLSGNRDAGSGLVMNQAKSIAAYDPLVGIDYYTVKGKGLRGYLKNAGSLRQKIKEFKPDVIHAHYSFCGFLSVLAFSRVPVVTSLMGSDLHLKIHWRVALFFASLSWRAVIVKSPVMKKKYLMAPSYVIPNGVELARYEPLTKEEARAALGLSLQKKYVLFLSDPERPEKNFKLAKEAFDQLNPENTELLVVHHVPYETTRLYYYAVDVLVLSSLYEGSPNVIKEAMVCNCPVVSTDVGDVRILFEGMKGYYLTTHHAPDFSDKLSSALLFAEEYGRTEGRARILALGIDSASIAKRIITLYSSLN